MMKFGSIAMLFFVFSHFLMGSESSPPCMPCATLIANSQADLNNLATIACTSINGDLIIESTNPFDPINNLGVLLNITEVTGDLIITIPPP